VNEARVGYCRIEYTHNNIHCQLLELTFVWPKTIPRMRRTGEIFHSSNVLVKIDKWIKIIVDMKFWGTKQKAQ
jgi:hypothetical protein